MRLFLAIELPEPWRRAAAEATAALSADHGDALRPVAPELMHLTVRFIGEIEDELVDPLQAALHRAILPVGVRLQLGGGGSFGRPARTGAVWLGVDGDLDRLHVLATQIEEAIAEVGLPPQERALRPHLTLARVRRQVAAAERRAIARAASALAAPAVEPFVARELALIRSRPGGDMPRYERLAIFGAAQGSAG